MKWEKSARLKHLIETVFIYTVNSVKYILDLE